MKKTISRRLGLAAVVIATLVLALAYPLGMRLEQTTAAADDINPSTTGTPFGVSGGNVNDISSAFCCSGTLGSLVKDSTGLLLILSNNHVLARSDAASPGEVISQPGLVDNLCQTPPPVATLTAFPSLGSNVDAAIAELTSNSPMATDGSINGIGTISSNPKKPAIGLGVQKSGRTTGTTSGTVQSFNTNVKVQYQARCGQGKKFTVSYTNQVVVTPGSFSAGGDSGSLILTSDSKKQPVALLFAGSSTTTIGNPICDVLAKVSSSNSNKTISFVGDSTLGTDECAGTASGSTPPPPGPSRGHQRANAAKERYADQLMSRPGVMGIGVGNTEDNKDSAVILYLDSTAPGPPFVPAQLDSVPVRVVRTDTFVSR
jgi:hypothetical protein